jgi:hypothetical protein
MNKHQVSVAAESQAAAVFAQAGYSVFVQYGANQPGYDLAVSNSSKTILVSVKGSQNGGWILTSKNSDSTYESALADWKQRHERFVFCFVQYQDISLGLMPRIYLALGKDVAEHLKTGNWGKINLSLIEYKMITKGKRKGLVQSVPTDWALSEKRIHALFTAADA